MKIVFCHQGKSELRSTLIYDGVHVYGMFYDEVPSPKIHGSEDTHVYLKVITDTISQCLCTKNQCNVTTRGSIYEVQELGTLSRGRPAIF